MKNNKLLINKWTDFTYNIDSKIISDNLIRRSLNKFRSQLNNLLFNYKPMSYPSSIKILILFKIKSINYQYRTITPLQIVNIEDFNYLYDLFIEFWNLKTEEYHLAKISDIIFVYKILDSNNLESKIITPKSLLKHNKINKEEKNLDFTKFGGFNLPNTMDFTKWGDTHFIEENYAIVYKPYSNIEYHIQLFENYQEVDIKLNDKIKQKIDSENKFLRCRGWKRMWSKKEREATPAK